MQHLVPFSVMMLFISLTNRAGMSKSVCTCRGQTYSLQPKQMVYMLPGSDYKEADLQQIHEEALKEADVALLADAWEVSSYISTCPPPLSSPPAKLLGFHYCLHFFKRKPCNSMQQLSAHNGRWQLLSVFMSVHATN